MSSMAVPNHWSTVKLSVFVASLIALPSLSIDIMMPGLVTMRSETGATLLESGLIITLFMVGLAAGQACLGPLSDSFGRRPVLLGGLALYVAAGIGCALATSPLALLALRILQGVGAGAGTVLALAIVHDLLEGDAARVVRSYAAAAFNVVPILAPSLGAMLLTASDWRAAYMLSAALGAGLLLWIFLRFGETHPTSKRNVVQARRTRASFLGRHFVSHVALNAASYAALMAYISGSSLVLMDEMGLSAQAYAFAFAGTSVALMLGAWANGRLARRDVRGSTLLAIGLIVGGTSSLSLAILPMRLDSSSWILIVFMVASRGLTGPNAQHAALEPIPDSAGAAAAILSLAQVLAGAAASAAVIPLYRTFGPQGVAYAIAGCSILAIAAWMQACCTNILPRPLDRG